MVAGALLVRPVGVDLEAGDVRPAATDSARGELVPWLMASSRLNAPTARFTLHADPMNS